MGLGKWWADFFRRSVDSRTIRRLDREREAALMAEIDRVLHETGSKIASVRGYRKRLLPPVRQALETIRHSVHRIPGPVRLDPERWGEDPVTNAVFAGPAEVKEWINSHEQLADAIRETEEKTVFALLAADHSEKIVFGARLVGEIVRRDIAERAVTFNNPTPLTAAGDLSEARIKLQHRILVGLVVRALDEILDLKAYKAELEKEQERLEFFLWEPEAENRVGPAHAAEEKIREAEELLHRLNRKLNEVERDLDSPGDQLDHVRRALMHPDRFFRMEVFTLRLDRRGIRVEASSGDSLGEMTLADFTLGGEEKRSAVWVAIERSKIKSVPGSAPDDIPAG